jgi:hypothetical protein
MVLFQLVSAPLEAPILKLKDDAFPIDLADLGIAADHAGTAAPGLDQAL